MPLQRKSSERRAQKEIVRRLRAAGYFVAAVPNGADSWGPGLDIAAGVEPGMPDLLVFDSPPLVPGARGAAVEMKKPGWTPPGRGRGRLPSEKWVKHEKQKVCLEKLRQRGWVVSVCVGAEEALGVLRGWGYLV
jgi:hypothetical protein